MASCLDLLERAKASPNNVRYVEVLQLAECFGWTLARQRGSHRVYKRPGTMRLLNFQDDDGKAKPYQVRQLLTAIEELGLEPED